MIMKLNKAMRAFHRDERGAVLPIMGITITLLLLITGMAIDMGRYFLVRNKVLLALDAGVLAAADVSVIDPTEEQKQEVVERGREYFRANFPAGYLGTTIDAENIEFTIDPSTGTVDAETPFELPLIFGGIYSLINGGDSRAQVSKGSVLSQAERGVTNRLEIAIVTDNSGSMCFQPGIGGLWPGDFINEYPKCDKYDDLTSVVDKFTREIETVMDATPDGEAYYAYVPFTHTVKIDGVAKHENDFCRNATLDGLPSIRGLYNEPSNMMDAITNADIPQWGATDSSVGFYYGYAALRPENNNIFVGQSRHQDISQAPAPFGEVENRNVRKVIILLSDGQNNYINAVSGLSCFRLSGTTKPAEQRIDDKLLELCSKARLEGIEVYTISFDVPSNSDVASLMESCASPNSYYSAVDSNALAQAFEDIGQRLIQLRLTK